MRRSILWRRVEPRRTESHGESPGWARRALRATFAFPVGLVLSLVLAVGVPAGCGSDGTCDEDLVRVSFGAGIGDANVQRVTVRIVPPEGASGTSTDECTCPTAAHPCSSEPCWVYSPEGSALTVSAVVDGATFERTVTPERCNVTEVVFVR